MNNIKNTTAIVKELKELKQAIERFGKSAESLTDKGINAALAFFGQTGKHLFEDKPAMSELSKAWKEATLGQKFASSPVYRAIVTVAKNGDLAKSNPSIDAYKSAMKQVGCPVCSCRSAAEQAAVGKAAVGKAAVVTGRDDSHSKGAVLKANMAAVGFSDGGRASPTRQYTTDELIGELIRRMPVLTPHEMARIIKALRAESDKRKVCIKKTA